MTWIFLLLYLLVQIAIGMILSRYIKNENDFFLAGRNVPTFALAFSVFATWFGAETCIGSSAAVFSEGLAGSKAEPLGYALSILFLAVFIAPKLWNKNYTTLGDFFKERYGNLTEKIAIWILVPSSLIWAAAQVKAFGQIIASVSPLPIDESVAVATSFVIIYALMGGLLGDIITDFIQGLILAITLVILLYFVLDSNGGFIQSINLIDPEKLNFTGTKESIFSRIDSWVIPIFGAVITQELIARILCAKDAMQAKRSSLYGMGLYLVFGSIPIFIALISPNLISLGDASSEDFLPMLAKSLMPSWLYILFLGALVSAILSTIDSILLAISALVSHNFLVPTLNISDPRKKLLSARIVLLLAGIASYVLAMKGGSIYGMVELAASFGTAGIFVATVGGLYIKKNNNLAANTVLILGIVLSLIFNTVFEIELQFSLSLILLSVLYIILSFSFSGEKFYKKSL